MGKIIAVALALFALAGCSNDNQIVIENDAMETITFNFRAVENQIAPGATLPINDIPNGTYAATLGTVLPSGATSWSITPSSGSFTFAKKSTKIRAAFGSTLTNGVYAVTWNYSSTDPSGTSPLSP
jgi:ribosomal protein L2